MECRSWFGGLFALALSVAGCRRSSAPQAPAAAEGVEIDARLRTVPLPEAPVDGLESVPARARVVIHSDSIDVDDAALESQWSAAARTRAAGGVAGPIVRRAVVRLEGGRIPAAAHEGGAAGFVVPALRDTLAEMARREQSSASSAPLALVIYAEPAVPARTVNEAVYNARRAGYADLRFALRRGGQHVVVRLDPGPADRHPSGAPEPPCVRAELVARADGVLVRHHPAPAPARTAASADPQVALALAAAAAATSPAVEQLIPRRAEAQDYPAVIAAVRALADHGTLCRSVRVSAAGELPWTESVLLLAAAQGGAGLEGATLGASP